MVTDVAVGEGTMVSGCKLPKIVQDSNLMTRGVGAGGALAPPPQYSDGGQSPRNI